MRVNVNATMIEEEMRGLIHELLPHIDTRVIVDNLEEVYARIHRDETHRVSSLSKVISDGLTISFFNMGTEEGDMAVYIAAAYMWTNLAQVVTGSYAFPREA